MDLYVAVASIEDDAGRVLLDDGNRDTTPLAANNFSETTLNYLGFLDVSIILFRVMQRSQRIQRTRVPQRSRVMQALLYFRELEGTRLMLLQIMTALSIGAMCRFFKKFQKSYLAYRRLNPLRMGPTSNS